MNTVLGIEGAWLAAGFSGFSNCLLGGFFLEDG